MPNAQASLIVSKSPVQPYAAELKEDVSPNDCMSLMRWPTDSHEVLRAFDAPPQPWLSGHRGIDLRTEPGTSLKAPRSGVISFSGKVAGKDVVTITHTNGWKSTFEPAVTDIPRGTHIHRGSVFAHVSDGASDHCLHECVHWGIKIAPDHYADPALIAQLRRVTILHPQD
ncbi:M23 family metallopeptidase [Alloscardovia venturai]